MDDPVILPCAPEVIRQLNALTARMFIVVRVPLKGGDHFMHELEHQYYPPGTPANDLFQLYIHYWQGYAWAIASIPWKERQNAIDAAAKVDMRIADGYPMLFKTPVAKSFILGSTRYDRVADKSEIHASFDVSSDRTFTLEAKHKEKGPVFAGVEVQMGIEGFWKSVFDAAQDTEKERAARRAARN